MEVDEEDGGRWEGEGGGREGGRQLITIMDNCLSLFEEFVPDTRADPFVNV